MFDGGSSKTFKSALIEEIFNVSILSIIINLPLLLKDDIMKFINEDLINYYLKPGQIYYLIQFFKTQKYNLKDYDLKSFLKLIIKDNLYKKDVIIKDIISQYFEFYFLTKVKLAKSRTFEYYDYFLKRINDTKKFNLDEESLFMEFEYKILNG